jgi:hypothetical protein
VNATVYPTQYNNKTKEEKKLEMRLEKKTLAGTDV